MKRHTPVDDLMPGWYAELDAAGMSVDTLTGAVLDAADRREPLPTIFTDTLTSDALAPGGRLAEVKVFTRHDVIVAVAPALYGQAPAVLDRVADAVTRSPDAIPLVGVPAARGRAWSPACVIAMESAIVHTLGSAIARTGAPAVSGAAVERAIWDKEATNGHPLTVGQTTAVIGICTSGFGAELVLGVAGAGKTTMLDVARDAFETAGFRVIGTSTSGQAARTLGRQAHIDESRTVASLLWRLDHDRLQLDGRTVMIVDESAMTDDPALLRLLTEAVTAHAKVVLVGDHRQLGPVGPGGALEGLCLRHPDAIHTLRENVRQADPDDRRVLAHLRSGDATRAVDWYAQHDRLHTAPDRPSVLTRMVTDWYQDAEAGTPTAAAASWPTLR